MTSGAPEEPGRRSGGGKGRNGRIARQMTFGYLYLQRKWFKVVMNGGRKGGVHSWLLREREKSAESRRKDKVLVAQGH